MTEKDLPAGEYKMIIVNDPRKVKTELKMKVAEGEHEGMTINIEMVV